MTDRGILSIVGIGPGADQHTSPAALAAIAESELVVGYTTYIRLVRHLIEGKEIIRTGMTEEGQALAFLAGANSIFVGDELLTTPNPEPRSDAALLAKLGLRSVAGCDARAASGGT